MSFAIKNLVHRWLATVLSTLSVGLALALMILLNGLVNGMNAQVAAYLDHEGGSVVVAQPGVDSLLGASSVLPAGTLDSVQQTFGVKTAVAIISQFVILDVAGRKVPAYLIGYDPAHGGGPWRLIAGHAPQASDEVVVDQVLAQRQNLHLGSTFPLLGTTLHIVGLSAETDSWMLSFLFISLPTAQQLMQTPGGASFILVTPTAGTSNATLQTNLAAIPASHPVLTSTLIANDEQLFTRIFSAPLQLMSGVAFLIGALVVALIIYTTTLDQRREYGTLKAIGARNRGLYVVVGSQALLLVGMGVIVGFGLAFGASQLIMALRPQFLVVLTTAALAQTLVVALGMAIIAAMLPAWRLGTLTPAEAFRR